MSETKKRVFWTQQEKQAVADEMHRLLESDPLQSKLQAVLKAQQVLPAERRRVVPAWTTVQEQIEPHLKIARANAQAASRQAEREAAAAFPTADVPHDAEHVGATGAALPDGHSLLDAAVLRNAAAGGAAASGATAGGTPGSGAAAGAVAPAAGSLAGLLAQQFETLTQIGSRMLGDAIVAALSDPAVEARLIELMQAAWTRAAAAGGAAGLPNGGHGLARPNGAPPSTAAKPKVLVAGLLPAQANELSEEFAQTLDIRHWRTTETAEQLRSQARHCAVAVAMVDAVDAATEALLRSMQLRYIRHTGGLDRLKDRLHELIDHGVFNLLSS